MYWAAANGHRELVDLLIGKGAELDVQDNVRRGVGDGARPASRAPPLHGICMGGSSEIQIRSRLAQPGRDRRDSKLIQQRKIQH